MGSNVLYRGSHVFTVERVRELAIAIRCHEPPYDVLHSGYLLQKGGGIVFLVPVAVDHGIPAYQGPDDLSVWPWIRTHIRKGVHCVQRVTQKTDDGYVYHVFWELREDRAEKGMDRALIMVEKDGKIQRAVKEMAPLVCDAYRRLSFSRV